MSVQCSKCGEELLGAVNRCWRCGHEFRSPGVDADVPPVRRPPIPMELVRSKDPATFVAGAAPEAVRRGSPFAFRGAASAGTQVAAVPPAATGAVTPAPAYYRPVATNRDPDPATEMARLGMALAAAYGSIGLALLGLFALPIFTWASILIAAAGITAGIWGLRSQRRSIAVIGLVLCGLLLLGAGYRESVELNRRYGEPEFDLMEEELTTDRP